MKEFKHLNIYYLVLIIGVFLTGNLVSAENKSLLNNGDFEQKSLFSNTPQSWFKESWRPGSSMEITRNKAHNGKGAICLYSNSGNDIRFIQRIKVKPNTIYRFSGWVSTENVTGGNIGANLSLIESTVHSEGIMGTSNWRPIEVVFKTNADQNQVTVAARLGYYGNTSSGLAFFDDLTLEEVSDQNIAYQQTIGIQAQSNQTPPQGPVQVVKRLFGYPLLVLVTYLLLLIGVWVKADELDLLKQKFKLETNLRIAFFSLVGVAFLIRLPLFGAAPFAPDLITFKAWALHIAETGPVNFYANGYACDYPPFSIYILWVIGWVVKTFALADNQWLFHFLIKFPSFLFDLGTAWLILILLKKKTPILALLLSGLYLLLPPVIYNSAYWGQMDTYYTFFMVLTFYLLVVKQQPEWAAVLVAASFLTKAQTIAFIPLLSFYLYQNYNWRRIVQTVLSGVVAFSLIILPFNIGKPVTWIVDLYLNQAALYPYASFFATNFITLIGGHAVPDNTTVFWGLSYYYLGLLLFLAGSVWAGYFYWRRKTEGSLAIAFTMAAFAFFMFFPRMHERYLFPIFAFLLLVIGYYKAKKLYFISLLLSLACLLNMHLIVVNFQTPLPGTIFDEAMNILSIIHTALFIALFIIFYLQMTCTASKPKDRLKQIAQKIVANLDSKIKAQPFSLQKRDYLTFTIIIFLYSIYIFWNLGSTRLPQTGMSLSNPQKGLEVTLVRPADLKKIVVYDGEESGALQVERFDGSKWNPVATINCNGYYVLTRTAVELNHIEWLRLIPQPSAGRINEIAFLNGQDQLIPVKAVRFLDEKYEIPGNETPLFDEQKMMTVTPSYMTSTYFDEIYHGRTAYEFIKGLPVYENTHPPLGKDILSLGILIFGMNPFGLRFMHALGGIFLMMMLFFLGRQVLATRFGAYTVMTLGMLDFMPFVQSRYASIDTFSVLFIGLMFLFTFKYIKEQEISTRPGSSRGTLTLIFLAFALAVSVKWTAFYAFAGILLCIAIVKFRQLWNYLNERAQYLKPKTDLAKAVGSKSAKLKESKITNLTNLNRQFWNRNILPTILWALVLICIVAPTIYFLSYIPYLHCRGIQDVFSSDAVQEVIQNQKGMYNYHSKLNATHPFSSPWWCWPFNFKPLWLYSGGYASPNHKETIVSLGNPLIWFLGVIALVSISYHLLKKRHLTLSHFGLLFFLAQYLPWVLVSRITFIYHYYPLLPLLYLFTAFLLESCWDTGLEGRKMVYTLLGIGLILLIMFYPALSGSEVPQNYVNFLRWFPKDWVF